VQFAAAERNVPDSVLSLVEWERDENRSCMHDREVAHANPGRGKSTDSSASMRAIRTLSTERNEVERGQRGALDSLRGPT
jgi:hypothetical protein